jgi:hypothetical protein
LSAKILSTAAILLSTTLALAIPQTATQSTAPSPASPAATKPAGNTTAAAKSPQPKTQAEYEAFKAASAITDPTKLETSATDFAQKFPDSDLRAFLFQQAMGEYQAAGNVDKALEMARAVLKYDAYNAVALLTAAQILSERTHDSDLDRDDRLTEAANDAHSALLHAGEIAQPPNLTPEQFAVAMAQLRGMGHEVIATVAFKKGDFFTAAKEYNAAAAEEKERTDAVVWLRLAVANDKSNDLPAAMTAIDKAIAASEQGSQIRQLSDQEKSRLTKLTSTNGTPSK